MKKKSGEILSERHQISTQGLAEAASKQQTGKVLHLGELLLERSLIAKEQLASALEEVTHRPYVDCASITPDPAILSLIPRSLAVKCEAIPIGIRDQELVIALTEPQNLASIDEIKITVGMNLSPRLGFRSEILAAIERCYGKGEPSSEASDSLPECGKEPEPGAGIVFISTSARQASRRAMQETPAESADSPEPAARIVSEMVSAAFRVGASTRAWSRFCSLKDLSLTYEGRSEAVAVHLPDISPKGMFINTTTHFPEGSVLKLGFRLARSNHRVETRCEVRYCVPGLGVGVEFMAIAPSDRKAIGDEIQPIKKKRRRRR
jgi:hypothetical protein